MAKPTFLDFLQAVYLNETLPLNVRLRAAIEAGPYELPKKPSSMSINYDETFAGRLERAVLIVERRLIPPKVIEHED
jgi:hypothetical protein